MARVKLEGVDDDREFVALVRRLRALAADRGVAGVLFKIENVELGYARIEELRDLIGVAARAAASATFAYAPSPSMREYYLAAAADAVVLHPAGELSLTGIAQNVTFYKAAMDQHRRPRRSGAHRRVQGRDGAVHHERAVARRCAPTRTACSTTCSGAW